MPFTVDQYKNVNIVPTTLKAKDYQPSMIVNDSNVQSVINEITAAQEPILNEVVAATPIALEGNREYVRKVETNLSRLITSAMLDETGADVAITNGGGIRASIDGEIQSLACIAQVAGIEVTYNPQAKAGGRIVSITKNGKAIKDNDTFIVATNDFMAIGGDGYTMLDKPVVNEFSALDEVLINYIAKIGAEGIKKIDNESPRVSIVEK